MTSSIKNSIDITKNGLLANPIEAYEPLPGSVVLSQGDHGTAWQRFFSDGLWHSVLGGKARTWDQMLHERNLVLVYDADPRR